MPRRRVVGDPVQAPAAAVHALGPDLAEEEIGQGFSFFSYYKFTVAYKTQIDVMFTFRHGKR